MDPVVGLEARVASIEAAVDFDQALVGKLMNELNALEASERRASRTTIRIDELRGRTVKVMNAGQSALKEAAREAKATVARAAAAAVAAKGAAAGPSPAPAGAASEEAAGGDADADADANDDDDAASSGNEAAQARVQGAGKRVRQKLDPVEKAKKSFAYIINKHPWTDSVKVDISFAEDGSAVKVTREDKYVKNGAVHCIACCKDIDCTDAANARAHGLGERHKEKWREHASQAKSAFTAGADKPATAQMSHEEKGELNGLLDHVRALAAAGAVGGGTNPAQRFQHNSVLAASPLAATLPLVLSALRCATPRACHVASGRSRT